MCTAKHDKLARWISSEITVLRTKPRTLVRTVQRCGRLAGGGVRRRCSWWRWQRTPLAVFVWRGMGPCRCTCNSCASEPRQERLRAHSRCCDIVDFTLLLCAGWKLSDVHHHIVAARRDVASLPCRKRHGLGRRCQKTYKEIPICAACERLEKQHFLPLYQERLHTQQGSRFCSQNLFPYVVSVRKEENRALRTKCRALIFARFRTKIARFRGKNRVLACTFPYLQKM